MKIFAVYRGGVFFGAVKLSEDQEQRSVLAIMEAGRRFGSEVVIREAPTIPIEQLERRLKANNPHGK